MREIVGGMRGVQGKGWTRSLVVEEPKGQGHRMGTHLRKLWPLVPLVPVMKGRGGRKQRDGEGGG